jgi:hypothetical protein
MWQLTIVYRIQIDGEWRNGIYRNLFTSYAEAYDTYMNAADPDDTPEMEIIAWDIS